MLGLIVAFPNFQHHFWHFLRGKYFSNFLKYFFIRKKLINKWLFQNTKSATNATSRSLLGGIGSNRHLPPDVVFVEAARERGFFWQCQAAGWNARCSTWPGPIRRAVSFCTWSNCRSTPLVQRRGAKSNGSQRNTRPSRATLTAPRQRRFDWIWCRVQAAGEYFPDSVTCSGLILTNLFILINLLWFIYFIYLFYTYLKLIFFV